MYQEYHKYVYNGPVLEFDRVVANQWNGETMAPSKVKAKSNLAYQFKKQHNRVPGSKITLPGDIKEVS